MTMARYTPHHWVLVAYVALVLVFVNPVTPHPVRTSQLAKNGDLEDLEVRGVWETSGNEEKSLGFQQSRAGHKLVSDTWFHLYNPYTDQQVTATNADEKYIRTPLSTRPILRRNNRVYPRASRASLKVFASQP